MMMRTADHPRRKWTAPDTAAPAAAPPPGERPPVRRGIVAAALVLAAAAAPGRLAATTSSSTQLPEGPLSGVGGGDDEQQQRQAALPSSLFAENSKEQSEQQQQQQQQSKPDRKSREREPKSKERAAPSKEREPSRESKSKESEQSKQSSSPSDKMFIGGVAMHVSKIGACGQLGDVLKDITETCETELQDAFRKAHWGLQYCWPKQEHVNQFSQLLADCALPPKPEGAAALAGDGDDVDTLVEYNDGETLRYLLVAMRWPVVASPSVLLEPVLSPLPEGSRFKLTDIRSRCEKLIEEKAADDDDTVVKMAKAVVGLANSCGPVKKLATLAKILGLHPAVMNDMVIAPRRNQYQHVLGAVLKDYAKQLRDVARSAEEGWTLDGWFRTQLAPALVDGPDKLGDPVHAELMKAVADIQQVVPPPPPSPSAAPKRRSRSRSR